MSFDSVARKLQQYGLKTIRGIAWTGCNIKARFYMRDRVEAAAAALGITSIFLPVADPGDDTIEAEARAEAERRAIARIGELAAEGQCVLAIERILEAEQFETCRG